MFKLKKYNFCGIIFNTEGDSMSSYKDLYVALENKYNDYIDKDKCVNIIFDLQKVFFLGYFEKVEEDKDKYIQNKLNRVKETLQEEIRKECLLQGKEDNSNEVSNKFFNLCNINFLNRVLKIYIYLTVIFFSHRNKFFNIFEVVIHKSFMINVKNSAFCMCAKIFNILRCFYRCYYC